MSDGETSSAVDREFGCLYEQCGDLSSKRAYPLKKHLDEVDAKNAFVHEHTIFHATVARHCWCRHSDKGRRAVPSCTQIGPATSIIKLLGEYSHGKANCVGNAQIHANENKQLQSRKI